MTAAGSAVWALLISHRHGEDVTIHTTEVGARGTLAAYVRTWWVEDGPGAKRGEPLPDDPDTAVGAYFDDSDEWYSLTERTVLDVPTTTEARPPTRS